AGGDGDRHHRNRARRADPEHLAVDDEHARAALAEIFHRPVDENLAVHPHLAPAAKERAAPAVEDRLEAVAGREARIGGLAEREHADRTARSRERLRSERDQQRRWWSRRRARQ